MLRFASRGVAFECQAPKRRPSVSDGSMSIGRTVEIGVDLRHVELRVDDAIEARQDSHVQV